MIVLLKYKELEASIYLSLNKKLKGHVIKTMNLLQSFTQFFKKDEPAQSLSVDDSFKKEFNAFKQLLVSNNQALEIMADMQEKLSGEYLFDRRYIESRVSLISESVLTIVDKLN